MNFIIDNKCDIKKVTDLEEVHSKTVLPLFRFTKALMKTHLKQAISVYVIVKNIFKVLPADKVDGYGYAGLSGFGKVLKLENNNIKLKISIQ